MKWIRLIFLIQLGWVSISNAQTADTSLGTSTLREELKMIMTTLKETHPGMNVFGQQKEFVSNYHKVDSLLALKDQISNIQYYRLVNEWLVNLQDGHFKFLPQHKNYPFYFNDTNVLPLIVRFDDKGQLIVANMENARYRGMILSCINGQKAEHFIPQLLKNMIVDGRSEAGAYSQLEQYFSAWYADYIDNPNSFTVELTDAESGAVHSVNLIGINYDKWKELDKKVGFLSAQQAYTIIHDSIAILRIPGFTTDKKEMRKFFESAFTDFKELKIKHLLIDVRGNEGGYDRLGKDLYSYIALADFEYYKHIEIVFKKSSKFTYKQHMWVPKYLSLLKMFIKPNDKGTYYFTKHNNFGTHKPQKNAFKGNIWFLQDGLSFSATTEMLSRAKADKRGQFAGTETGGSYKYDCSGTFVFLNLPTSKFTIGIPIGEYQMAVPDDNPRGRGIMPDLKVLPTVNDITENKDVVLEKVLKQIESKSLKVVDSR
ncbi:S41 family peptidase [Solitalea sp. MAHUQ-68]|uniref:S41 family peptidase n=1 Tax=Solitalea agri TaxID=2953739 RepID=A0A9X2JFD5_9SPHI|nr:S41 family peptidase [Solitalea agri]MCO4293291.1 S41 family peptidase [Solitalea agri]